MSKFQIRSSFRNQIDCCREVTVMDFSSIVEFCPSKKYKVIVNMWNRNEPWIKIGFEEMRISFDLVIEGWTPAKWSECPQIFRNSPHRCFSGFIYRVLKTGLAELQWWDCLAEPHQNPAMPPTWSLAPTGACTEHFFVFLCTGVSHLPCLDCPGPNRWEKHNGSTRTLRREKHNLCTSIG